MTGVTIGYTAEFWLDDTSTSPATPTKLSEVIGVGLPNSQVAEVEATHMESPDRRREWISGLIDDGEGTFEINYIPGSETDELIREALSEGDQRGYKVVLPVADGTTWEVSGLCIVKGYERSVPIDDRMTATVTIRFTGESTEQAGTP